MDENHLRALLNSLVFNGLNYDELRLVLEKTVYQLRTFLKGELIAQAASECNYARVIVEGKVSAEMMDANGKILKIEDISPSGMIAPAFLYGSMPRYPVNVYATEETLIWQIARNDFSHLMQEDVRILNNYLNAISSRTQFLSEKVRFLSFPSLKAKISGLILHYSFGQNRFRMPLTHKELSEMFGVARPSLSREISALNTMGLIRSERDNIEILDRKKLLDLTKEI